jgi:predicted RNA polymerase sigma factor
VREAFGEDVIRDDQLRMIFMCCHPSLSSESQLTLILRTLCGLSVPATARALVASEATIHKRMVRIRQRLKGVEFELPRPEQRAAALETTHAALYLLFNEGHLSTDEQPIRRELCRAAMELTQLVADEPTLASSDTLGLLALMCFQAARMDSRLDANGDVVPLDQQDRARWDRELIGRGYGCLVRASQMDKVVASRYHLEAAIAARHCEARAFADTDWASICRLYDRLVELAPSPLAELNRAVAVSYRDGPEAAIPIVEELRRSGRLAGSHAVAAVLANLYARTGAAEPSRRHLEQALASARTRHERQLIALQVERARGGYAGGSKTG